MSEKKVWNKLGARRLITNLRNGVTPEECRLACEYLSRKELERVLVPKHQYVDAYVEAAITELMERRLLGKKREILK